MGGRRISGHGAEELFDGAGFDARLRLGVLSNGAFFNARLHSRLFRVHSTLPVGSVQPLLILLSDSRQMIKFTAFSRHSREFAVTNAVYR